MSLFAVDAVAKEFQVTGSQIAALLNKALHRIHLHFHELLEQEIKEQEQKDPRSGQVLELPQELPDKTFVEELNESAMEVELKERSNNAASKFRKIESLEICNLEKL